MKKKIPENSPNRQKSSKLAPEGACRAKFASWTPKSAKMERKWRPRGDPCDPPRDPKIVKIVKKNVIKTSSFFQHPSGKGFYRFVTSKIELKWLQNEVSESRGRGNSKKHKNLKFAIPSTKITYFSRSKNMQNWQTPRKMHAKNDARTKMTLQKRFFMILPPFWSSQGSLK